MSQNNLLQLKQTNADIFLRKLGSSKHPSKSSKVSKDWDSTPVSIETLGAKYRLSSGWALGQMTWAKNLSQIQRNLQKKQNPKPNFFIAVSKTCLVFQGFEQLSCSIVGEVITGVSFLPFWLRRSPGARPKC